MSISLKKYYRLLYNEEYISFCVGRNVETAILAYYAPDGINGAREIAAFGCPSIVYKHFMGLHFYFHTGHRRRNKANIHHNSECRWSKPSPCASGIRQ
jgi:hypothetical protein